MWGLKSTAIDVQAPPGKRLLRKRFTAAQAACCAVALETPHTPPCPNKPKVQYLSKAPGPTAWVRPWCFHSVDHRSRNFTRLASEGFLRGVPAGYFHAFYIAGIYHGKHPWP